MHKDQAGQWPGRLLEAEVAQRTAALSRQRDFLDAVFDTAGALIIILDAEGRIVRLNRQAERVTGLTMAQAHLRPIWELLPLEIDFTAGELRESLPEDRSEDAEATSGAEGAGTVDASGVDAETVTDADTGQVGAAGHGDGDRDTAPPGGDQTSEEPVDVGTLAPDGRSGAEEAAAPDQEDDESLWLSSILKEDDGEREASPEDPERRS